MEVVKRTAAAPSLAVKPSLKQRTTRQPLAGVGNRVLGNVTNKDRSQVGKPVKPALKKAIESEIAVKSKPEVPVKSVIKAFSSASLPDNVDDIDSEDAKNPQLVSQYVNEIYQYLRYLEVKFPIRKNYLECQTEVTGKMRAILIDWLVQVHLKFHLLQETLYLTVSIIDRYLQVDKVRRNKLQLVGVTAMFIASKFEEMYAPEVGDFVYVTDNTYTKEDIFRMEQLILKKLNFSLCKPLPLHFLRRFSKAGNVDSTMHTLAKYLMELVLPEYELVQFCPSVIAASALYISIKLLEETEWNDTLVFYTGYSESDFLPIVSLMCKVLLNADSVKLQAIRGKYSSSKLLKISLIPQLKSDLVRKLANPCS